MCMAGVNICAMSVKRVRAKNNRSATFGVRVSRDELDTIYRAAELAVQVGTSDTAGAWARRVLLEEARAMIKREGV
jgi:hypothetical protein